MADLAVTWPTATAGTTVSGTCAPGYSGSPQRTCAINGAWLAPAGVACVRTLTFLSSHCIGGFETDRTALNKSCASHRAQVASAASTTMARRRSRHRRATRPMSRARATLATSRPVACRRRARATLTSRGAQRPTRARVCLCYVRLRASGPLADPLCTASFRS